MVLVLCAAVKTAVEDESNMLCVRLLGCAYAAFDSGFLKKTMGYTVMVLYCTRVHQLDVYCHCTVLLLLWILSYFRVKKNVIVCLLLFGRFCVKLRGSV